MNGWVNKRASRRSGKHCASFTHSLATTSLLPRLDTQPDLKAVVFTTTNINTTPTLLLQSTTAYSCMYSAHTYVLQYTNIFNATVQRNYST